jgi:cytosine/adenosine deaminase-related metal-dependent hydrolase
MAYRKFKADLIFTGREFLEDDCVLVSTEDGCIEGLIPLQDAGEGIERLQGILCPGFINCHCHLELSHLKGVIPSGTGLTDFVYKVISGRHVKEEEIEEAIRNAEDEMLANGIVAVGDICNNLLTLKQKEKQRLFYYNFIETSGWDPAFAQTRFEKSKLQYDSFNQLLNSRNQTAMAPHAPYSVSDELWDRIMPFFANKTTTIHNQEAPFEDEWFKTGTGDLLRMYEMLNIKNSFFKPSGKSSLQTYLPRLDLAENILLVHNTFTGEEDLQFCQGSAQKLFFCICVNANLYIENALPPLDLLSKYHCRIVLGTDSLASNRSLNILEEIKTVLRYFPDIPHSDILQWATLQGAQALALDDILGSFEPGRRPGINLIEKTRGEFLTQDSSLRKML